MSSRSLALQNAIAREKNASSAACTATGQGQPHVNLMDYLISCSVSQAGRVGSRNQMSELASAPVADDGLLG